MFPVTFGRPQLEAEMFMACLGKAIRDHRWALHISQRQVALHAGIDQTFLDEIENALAETLSVEMLRKIAQALNIPASYLMKQAEERMMFEDRR